ncbi:helix-turn-helix transcriptional regulator, partial [Enterococcus faecalis]|nr:helix-turn-helix transcriptional regulator [Enterococcus faecalis]
MQNLIINWHKLNKNLLEGAFNLEKKEINFLLKQVRLDTGLKQKDARAGVMSAVSYSKMENGRKSLAFEELVSILTNLQVSLEEFLVMYVQPVLTESARLKLIRLVDQLPSEDALNQIFSMFNEYVERFPDLSSDEMGVYFDVKALFHREYPEKVPPVVHAEQKLAIERIMNKAQYK